MAFGFVEKLFGREPKKIEKPEVGTQVRGCDAWGSAAGLPAVRYGESIEALNDAFSNFSRGMIVNHSDPNSLTTSSLYQLIYGEFQEENIEKLEALKRGYSNAYSLFRKNLSDDEKRALVTLETVASARIDYLKRFRGKKNYKNFARFLSGMIGVNSTYLKYGDNNCAMIIGNADELDDSIAAESKGLGYGTIHKNVLDGILEADEMEGINGWIADNYEEYRWKI